MAIKTLSSDMAELVNAMRLAQKHATTLLADDYRKAMLKAAHVLAFNSKNLIVAVDNGRKAAVVAAAAATATSQKSLPRHSTSSPGGAAACGGSQGQAVSSPSVHVSSDASSDMTLPMPGADVARSTADDVRSPTSDVT